MRIATSILSILSILLLSVVIFRKTIQGKNAFFLAVFCNIAIFISFDLPFFTIGNTRIVIIYLIAKIPLILSIAFAYLAGSKYAYKNN